MKPWYVFSLLILVFFSFPVHADQPTDEQQTINTVQNVLSSTVKVQADAASEGTGFYIASNEILTNYHVIEHVDYRLTVITYDNRTCDATLGYREEGLDLAILRTDCQGKPLTVTSYYKLGQTIIAIGNPIGFDFTATKGIVSATRFGMIQMDTKVNNGSSGGPVVDLNGNVIGILTQKAHLSDYAGFAITGHDILQFIERSNPVGSAL